jgi:predicted amidohydrolase
MYAKMESVTMQFTVALLPITPLGNHPSANLAKGLQYCREAKALGADLAVFPELWSIGCTRSPMDSPERQIWIDSAIDRRSTFFQTFADLARELDLNIAITYLEAHQPLPRNTVSVINRRGEVMLNYSKVFIGDFGKEEFLKPNASVNNIGCDANCSPGDSFDVSTLAGSAGQVNIGAMICANLR